MAKTPEQTPEQLAAEATAKAEAERKAAEQAAAAAGAEAQAKIDEANKAAALAEQAAAEERAAKAAADQTAGKVQVEFKRPLAIGTTDYPVGTHWVPEGDTVDNWFFDAHVREGNLVPVAPERAADGRPKSKK